MYYAQNTKSIKTIILSFDGVMTTLSKLRFNYYRRFCKLYDQQLNIQTYYQYCNSQETMYQHCPIPSHLISTQALCNKVEDDLLAYSKHHGIKINEGFDELFQLTRTKKVEIIYTSTHSKKYTEPLFHLTGTRYRPHAFYYDDITVYEQYKNNPEEVLVIASDLPTLKLANQYRYNVIYYPVLQSENEEITIRSFATIHHLIGAINLILDNSRIPKHQYLLINETSAIDANYTQLKSSISPKYVEALTRIYEEEKEKINLLHITEEISNDLPTSEESLEEAIFIEEINQTTIENDISINETVLIDDLEDVHKQPSQPTTFLDKIMNSLSEETDFSEDENSIQLPLIENTENLFEKTMELDFKITDLKSITNEEVSQIKENKTIETEQENFTFEPMEGIDENTHTDIDTIIEELSQKKPTQQIFTKQELKEFGIKESDLYQEDDEDNDLYKDYPSVISTFFSTFIYAIVDSAIILLIYLAMSIGLYDWIFKENSPLYFIKSIIQSIYNVSQMAFGSIANGIGKYINASASLNEGIAVFLLLTCVLWFVLFIIELIKNRRGRD